MRELLTQVACWVPQIKRLKEHRDQLLQSNRYLESQLAVYSRFVPPGHFYSPIPDLDEVNRDLERLYPSTLAVPAAVDLNHEEQLQKLDQVAAVYPELPWAPGRDQKGLRYTAEGARYPWEDAICLYGIIRLLRPKRILEVGSGYSSCVILDTNERFFDNSIRCTYVEPYPDVLLDLIHPEDRDRIELLQLRLQDVPDSLFSELGPNDILFIDSTHVSKIGSDVNRLFFNILPALAKGVYVHIHDIMYPFEYPLNWITEGRAWNETYMLRSFLMYNQAFKIALWASYLRKTQADLVSSKLPLADQGPGGSIWLRKEG